jgi:hypothetical protein
MKIITYSPYLKMETTLTQQFWRNLYFVISYRFVSNVLLAPLKQLMKVIISVHKYGFCRNNLTPYQDN